MNRWSIRRASPWAGAALVAALVTLLSGCASNDPVWLQNQADLKKLEACGYTPKAWDPYYPDDIQRAEARAARGECGVN